MDKNFKPVYVQGTETGKGVIEALEAFGGINKNSHHGINDGDIYYIDPEDYTINTVSKYSLLGKYIIATSKKIIPLRWRAKKGSKYYVVTANLQIMETNDVRGDADNDFYRIGNYFKTKEEAKEVLEKIKLYFKH